LSFRVPGSGMAEVKGPPVRRPSVGRRVSTGMIVSSEINLRGEMQAKGQSFGCVQECLAVPRKTFVVTGLFIPFPLYFKFFFPTFNDPFNFLTNVWF
uniref:Uncharacterized protein n=1 Tax=Cyprinus carpio TaxID=7962 RepID=A0A8C2F7U9_CYPCA